jgi:predicted AAA+ superfamily ATPase
MIIKRELYLSELRPLYDNNLIKVLLGPRRSGKSEILKMVRDELAEKGVDGAHILYLNFEDVTFEDLLDYQKLNAYVLGKITDHSKYYLMFDEIQHVALLSKRFWPL